MQVIVHGKNINITYEIKNAVDKNFNYLQEKYSKYIKKDMIAKVGIERNSNHTYNISVHIQLLNNNFLQCLVENHDLYVGINKTLVPLEKQLSRLKTVADKTGAENVGQFITKEILDDNSEVIIDVTENNFNFVEK
ncbi:ribosome hibernation-promoting factor, HPF/YfiA family [Spiroplasma endosymbiont of Amphimallon solstitiale]|uniref:ribosome hibernation-promoting factor, HPF/YfiA family n=1 Tax=Spiroplasma endosymbiont of Amphimallon solstitiale TaxID=3066288 RepID=UPI00313DF280